MVREADSREKIRVGPVLMTKNPCIGPGDVRMFEAIDVPELRHLVGPAANAIEYGSHLPGGRRRVSAARPAAASR